MLVKATEDNEMTMKEFWKRLTIRNSIMLLCETWKAVTRSCMNGAWKKLCPYPVYDFKGFSVVKDVSTTRKSIMELAKK